MKPNPLSQFIVTELVPENRGNEGRAFQLTENSVSPTRIIRRNIFNETIEETICPLAKHANFVDSDGNIVTVPLRTGRVLSSEPEAVRYEDVVINDQLLAGSFPLEMCPHTQLYRSTVRLTRGGRLIDEPLVDGDPIEDCGGRPGAERLEEACPHMRALVQKRREHALDKNIIRERELTKMTPEQANNLLSGMAQALGIAQNVAKDTRKPSKRYRVEDGDKIPVGETDGE